MHTVLNRSIQGTKLNAASTEECDCDSSSSLGTQKDRTVHVNLHRFRHVPGSHRKSANTPEKSILHTPSVLFEYVYFLTVTMYHFCNGKEFNQKGRWIASFIYKIFLKSFPVISLTQVEHILSDDKLGSSVICGMLQMQAGGRGPGKNLWDWTHPDFTPHHYLLPGGISTHHGRCGIQEAHDLHLNVILAKALQHLHNLTHRQPLTIHVLNGNNIIPFLGSCRLKKNMISIQVNVLFSEIPEVVPKFINKIVICVS